MDGESEMRGYSYGWLTALFFVVSIVGHWTLGWFAFAEEEVAHGETAHLAPYLVQMGRDTLENWQSEFLQLIWQVIGLAYFLYLGSPASKENSERAEEKLDAILKLVAADQAEQVIAGIDKRFMRK